MPQSPLVSDWGIPTPWPGIREFLEEMGPTLEHEVAIVRSIEASDVADRLTGKTSMHSLMVAAIPIRPGPVEYIMVHAPNATFGPRTGNVAIEHRSSTGRSDRIERPIGESVALFWRFASEKFGIIASRP